MKNTPYTVLMSVYIKEKAEYLKLSIQSMLDQTVPPDEFILVKDGPLTMELDAVVDYYNQKYPGLFTIISNETNLGLGPALAKGIVTSRNELIARMDSDDISEKTRCEKQLLAFEKNTDLEMVGSFEAEFIGEKDNVVSIHRVPETHSDIAKFMRRRCAILHPTVMYKKGAVIRSGNYHSVPLYEDYDLFARMVLEYNVRSYNIQENLYYIRTSEDGFKDDDMGLSNVYVRTQKAIDLWKQIETQVTAVKTETAVTNKNDGDMIYESAVKNKARAEFWSDYGKLSYTELIDKYIPYSKKEAIMDKVKRVMVSTGLSKNLKIKKLLTKIKK